MMPVINTQGCSYKGGRPGDRGPETNHCFFFSEEATSPPFSAPFFSCLVALIMTVCNSFSANETDSGDHGLRWRAAGWGGLERGCVWGGVSSREVTLASPWRQRPPRLLGNE